MEVDCSPLWRRVALACAAAYELGGLDVLFSRMSTRCAWVKVILLSCTEHTQMDALEVVRITTPMHKRGAASGVVKTPCQLLRQGVGLTHLPIRES